VTHWEKRAWIRLVVAILGYAAYLIVVLSSAQGRPLTSVPYAAVLLWTVGAAIVAAIAAEAVTAARPRASRTTDARDREIGRLGDHVGQSFVVIGAVAAMLMAMAGWDHFWIANVIYLCFALSAVLAGVTKVVVYRRSMPEW
jgi:drug/metabolite transporter (DMT)-like permease